MLELTLGVGCCKISVCLQTLDASVQRLEVKTHTDRFIKLIRHSFGFSQLNWSAQEKRGLTKQP